MKIQCEYCKSFISDTDEKCPNCGATNNNLKRVGEGVPQTIEELKKWYQDHNLPSEEVTRFFIGKDYKEKRAFGIYYDEVDNKYVVYKNKDDGSRAIRYEGKDEKYAVNELYLRLKEEIFNQKQSNKRRSSSIDGDIFSKWFYVHFFSVFIFIFVLYFNVFAYFWLFLSLNPGCFIMIPILSRIKDKNKKVLVSKLWNIFSLTIFLIIIIMVPATKIYNHRNDAYYTNNNITYYNYGNSWYYFDNDKWNPYSGNTDDFDYLGSNYNNSYNASDFKDSYYYTNIYEKGYGSDSGSSSSYGNSSTSSSDWDSSSSWDSSDSWDSSSTDWDSDW